MSDNKKQLIMMVNLCGSILEGLEYLTGHPGSRRLLNDSLRGLQALDNSLEELKAAQELRERCQALIRDLENDRFKETEVFAESVQNWYTTMSEALLTLLEDENAICPVCGGKGDFSYIALYYDQKSPEAIEPLEASWIWWKCRECSHYYVTRERQPKQS